MAAPCDDTKFYKIKDLYELYERASEFATSGHGVKGRNSSDEGDPEDRALCRWFYRNKSQEYFQTILERRGGIMEVELKDASGDPRSPINGRVSGMFFMASVGRGSKTGEPIRVSPFGPIRLLVPVEDLLRTASNLYFADFYCMTGKGYHYVTLVMTVPGSEADEFCAEFLLDLDLWKNPFLIKDESGQLRVTTREGLLVEVFYTANLDIRSYRLEEVIQVIGKGRSTVGGLPKRKNCTTCNL